MSLAVSPRTERLKEMILATTCALLAEVGVGGLTVDAVAARAGVGKATVYRHWASRAELIVDAVSSLVTDDEAIDRGSLRLDLEAAYERICQVCGSSVLAQVLPTLAEAAGRDPELEGVHKELVARRRRQLVAALERAAERGELRPGLDLAIAADLVAGPMFYKKLVDHQRPDEAYAKILLDMVVVALARPG